MRWLVYSAILILVIVLPACRDQSKEEIFSQGMEFAESGNQDAAISFFKRVLEKDPNDIDARFQLGAAYQETSKFDKAENELKKVLLLDPSKNEALKRLAQIYVRTDKLDNAIQILTDLEVEHPGDVEILSSLGECYALKGEYELSEAKYSQALAIQPTHFKSQIGMTKVLFLAGRPDDAQQMLLKTSEAHPQSTVPHYLNFKYALKVGDRDKAKKSLEQIISIHPNDDDAAYLLALLYLDTGELEKGYTIAENFKTSEPEDPRGPRIAGIYYYLKGDYQKALIELQQSLKRLPDMSGYYLTGVVYSLLHDYELALSNFQMALDKEPENWTSRLMVAQTLLKQGRIDDCIREARIVLDGNPENGQAHNLLGGAFLAQGQYDRAMQELNTAIELEPSLASAYLQKGLFNLATGNSQQGVSDLQNSLAAAPEILNTRFLLATYYLKQHNYPSAINVLKEGLNGSPDSALIYNYIAAAYFAQNKNDEAVAALQKAKNFKPDYMAPYFNLANYYINLGDNQAAIDELLAALASAPDKSEVQIKLASLYELTGDVTLAAKHYSASRENGEVSGYLAYAAFLARSGQREKSLEVLRAGYALHPDDLSCMVALGRELQHFERYAEAKNIYVHLEETFPGKGLPLLIRLQLAKGEFSAAKETATRVINEHPKDEYGYLLLSAIHEHRKELPLAENAIKHALMINKDNIALHMNLAHLYVVQGKNEEAMSTYDSILTKDPNFIPAKFGKGAIYDRLGNKLLAEGLYKQILARDENYVPALNNLAYLTLENYADYKEALKLAVKAFRISPDNADVIDTLGYALLKNGKAQESIAFLEKANSLLPQEVSILSHLAQAYKAVGRNADAVTSLAAINEINAQKN